MSNEVHAPLTWQLRLVSAVAKEVGCSTTTRQEPRTIGGRRTSKRDRLIKLIGDDAVVSAATARIEGLFGDLNARSEAYVRSPALAGSSPADRRLARRAWLEHEAQRVSKRLTGGTKNGRTRPTP